jgi:hypothetical protein
MSRSAIYVANTNAQTVPENGTINPGTIVRRFGCNLGLAGTGIQIQGAGYYDIDASITVTPSAAGILTIAVLKDNVEVPGGMASFTVEADSVYTLPISALVRENCACCEGLSNLTFVLQDVAAEVNNIAVIVEKI